MIPLLIGSASLLLLGSVMLLAAAFAASTAWGVLCLLLPPLQWVFAVLNWDKAWDGLLLQVLGIAMALAFYTQAGGMGEAQFAQAWGQFRHQHMLSPSSAGTVVIDSQTVQTLTAESATGGAADIQSLSGDNAAVAVVAGASKAVDDKPIFLCTDAQGKETYSTKPCPTSAK
jgi:hypothetical protein